MRQRTTSSRADQPPLPTRSFRSGRSEANAVAGAGLVDPLYGLQWPQLVRSPATAGIRLATPASRCLHMRASGAASDKYLCVCVWQFGGERSFRWADLLLHNLQRCEVKALRVFESGWADADAAEDHQVHAHRLQSHFRAGPRLIKTSPPCSDISCSVR